MPGWSGLPRISRGSSVGQRRRLPCFAFRFVAQQIKSETTQVARVFQRKDRFSEKNIVSFVTAANSLSE